MSNIFQLSRDPRDFNQVSARRAKLDVITAAMLTGGASGVWGVAKAYRSRAARDAGYSRAEAGTEIAAPRDEALSHAA